MTRVALASNPLFVNAFLRPYRSGRTAPRLVENLMGGVSSTAMVGNDQGKTDG